MLIWTMHTLGKNLTDTVVTRKDHTLVTGGPYRFVRHPFYCATILVVPAISTLAANWFLLLIGVSVLKISKRKGAQFAFIMLGAMAVPLAVYAATIGMPNTFVNGTTADAGEVNTISRCVGSTLVNTPR